MSARPILLALAIASAIGAVKLWQSHLLSQGDAQGAARVQMRWDQQERERDEATSRDNATKFRNAERVADEDAQREAARRARDVAAAAAVRGLRAEIARLNARAEPYPAGDAGLAACAGEAATARQLLAESSSAYQELAAEADGLGDQIAGLQDFAHNVCRAGSSGFARATPEQPGEGATID